MGVWGESDRGTDWLFCSPFRLDRPGESLRLSGFVGKILDVRFSGIEITDHIERIVWRFYRFLEDKKASPW
jgi:hypothetical protein